MLLLFLNTVTKDLAQMPRSAMQGGEVEHSSIFSTIQLSYRPSVRTFQC
jgi:hypothetical protein